MSDTDGKTGSAQRAQDQANDVGMTDDDERAARDEFDRTGEPQRDNLGNQDGAS